MLGSLLACSLGALILGFASIAGAVPIVLISHPGASASLGGQTFSNNDVLEYDPVSEVGALFFDGSALGFGGNINALHVIPEPSTALLLASGLVGLAARRRARAN